jgi:hypothetical protein
MPSSPVCLPLRNIFDLGLILYNAFTIMLNLKERPNLVYVYNQDPEGFSKAVAKLRMLLNEEGQIWFTVPIGYNPYVDEDLRVRRLENARFYFMRRISLDNRWRECNYFDVSNCPYGGFKITNKVRFPYPKANAIVIVNITNKQ